MVSVPGLRSDMRGLMRGAAHGSRSRYLSMALASRKLMNRLDSFASTGEHDPTLSEPLQNLLSIMEAKWQTENSFAPVPGRSPFSRYEQALVVNEVAAPFSANNVRGKLKSVIDGTVDHTNRVEVVREINEFLYDLENMALNKYSEESSEREW